MNRIKILGTVKTALLREQCVLPAKETPEFSKKAASASPTGEHSSTGLGAGGGRDRTAPTAQTCGSLLSRKSGGLLAAPPTLFHRLQCDFVHFTLFMSRV